MTEKLSKLMWLKRTHGHPLTGPEFRVLVSIFNATGSDGRNAHPGIDRLIEETGYRRTGVSEAVSGLKAKGWIHQRYRGNGKSKQASVFDLVPDAPNPEYRCPEDRLGKCSACSNSSARADVLTLSNSSATAEVLGSNSSGRPDHVPGETGPIVPPGRTPSDLLSDPLGVPSERPSDPSASVVHEDDAAVPSSVGTDARSLLLAAERYTPSGGEDDRGDERSPRESEGGHEPKTRNEGDGPPGLLGLGQGMKGRDTPAPSSVVRWPSAKPIPKQGEPEFDPFVDYVDESTGELIDRWHTNRPSQP